MNHKEYIIPIGEEAQDYDEMFIGVIRRQPELVRCKDCKYYRDGDCWHECDNDGQIYYQSVINEPNPDDYCSRAERKEE
jgi:hypothetical protein